MSRRKKFEVGQVIEITDELTLKFSAEVMALSDSLSILSLQRHIAKQEMFDRLYELYPRLEDFECTYQHLDNTVVLVREKTREAHCRWEETENGTWHTTCEHSVRLYQRSTPSEMGMIFCSYCSHPIEEVPDVNSRVEAVQENS